MKVHRDHEDGQTSDATPERHHLLTLTAEVHLRLAQRRDIPRLEWFGEYSHFRNVFRRTYHEQQQGKRLMLLADYNDFPIGQVFVQLRSQNTRIADGRYRAYLYSFRVMEMFRGQGLGTRLMLAAETLLQKRGYSSATIAVAKDNHGALRLYDRLGYHKFASDPGEWHYVDHHGNTREVIEPCWLLEHHFIGTP